MKSSVLFFILGICIMATPGYSASCSKANLTRCLDSVCAINISTNPAARCQYCGSDSAGVPPTDGMRSVSVGQSAKFTLSDKELKKAPTDPSARYQWATAQCLTKVGNCTPDDVTDAYDKLIEQSCTAAGIAMTNADLRKKALSTKTSASCQTEIRSCIIASNRCGADWRACEQSESFDKFLAECAVASTGCDEHMSTIRTKLASARDDAIKGAAEQVKSIIASYQNSRQQKLNSAKASCADNTARDECVQSVCERSMANKCAAGYESEKSMATQICKFHDLACSVLK